MADPNINPLAKTTPLIPTERATSIPVADGDKPVTHIAGQLAETNEKGPPPQVKKSTRLADFLSANKSNKAEDKKSGLHASSDEASLSTSSDDQHNAMETGKKTGSGLNKLQAFLATTTKSTKSEVDSAHEYELFVDQDAESVTGHDGMDAGVRPEPLGTLGRPAPFHKVLQRKVDDLAAKQLRDEALNGPPKFTLANGMKVVGDMARRLQAIEDARPENMFKSMGGVSATPSVKERVDGINAKPNTPESLPPKPILAIPERGRGFDEAKAKFTDNTQDTSAVDKWRRNNPVEIVQPDTSVKDMIARLQPKKPN